MNAPRTPPLTAEESREIEAFVYDEARLLDEQRFDDWLALFADDGIYWAPSQPGQASPAAALSLFYERTALLAVRVRRLAQADSPARNPSSRTLHHVAAVRAGRSVEPGVDCEAHASLVFAEWRNDEARWYAGRTFHRLRRTDAGLRIVEKRVDLINCDAPHRALVVPF